MNVDIKRMPVDRAMQILRAAAVLALLALALMMWSTFDPVPSAVLVGLSVGQVLGTLSFAAYLTVVLWDLRRRRRVALLDSSTSLPPPSGPLLGSSDRDSTTPPPPSSKSLL